MDLDEHLFNHLLSLGNLSRLFLRTLGKRSRQGRLRSRMGQKR